MKYIYLSIFIIATTIHLIASYKKDDYLRALTKGFIVYSLLSFYSEWVEIVNYFVVIALIFSWLGDLFLIGKGTKWFTAGGIAFMLSHIFFIISYGSLTDFSNIPIYVYPLVIIPYIVAVIFIFNKLKPLLKKILFYPMFSYLLINGLMNSFAIFRLVSNVSLSSIITVVGAVSFFISDTSLFFVRFNKDSVQKSHFLVMLTYSIAELLIVLGFIL